MLLRAEKDMLINDLVRKRGKEEVKYCYNNWIDLAMCQNKSGIQYLWKCNDEWMVSSPRNFNINNLIDSTGTRRVRPQFDLFSCFVTAKIKKLCLTDGFRIHSYQITHITNARVWLGLYDLT